MLSYSTKNAGGLMFCELCGKFTTVQKFVPPRSKTTTRLICVCPKCFNHLDEQLTAITIVSEIFEGMSSKMEDIKSLLSNNSLEFVRGYFTARLLSYLRDSTLLDDTTKSIIISLFQEHITPFLIDIKNDIKNTNYSYVT